MTTRNDVVVDYNLSPRVITIAAPSIQITIQDLVDTVRKLEDSWRGMSETKLINAAGKENLGGGVLVGITAELQNAQVAFESRNTPKSTGTATSTSARLIDTGATFESDGVIRGASIVNLTTGDVSDVYNVISETELSVINNPGTFTSGDSYQVYNIIQCEVTGGNLVALDDIGSELSPVFTTDFTQIVRTASSSATIAELQIIDLVHRIESLRERHGRFGDLIYWNPTTGNDGNIGDSPERAVQTFAQAHTLVNSGGVIYGLTEGATGIVDVTETITIDKDGISLRGPGQGFRFLHSSGGGDTIHIQANRVELTGFVVEHTDPTAQNGIHIDGALNGGDEFSLRDITLRNIKNNAVEVNDSGDGVIDNLFIEDCDNDGIHLGDNLDDLRIKNCLIDRPANNGICVFGNNILDTIIRNSQIHDCGNYGMYIGAGANQTIIRNSVFFFDNITGDIFEHASSTNTTIQTTMQELMDILEADEEMTPTTATKKHKDTGVVLVQKNVTGGDLTGTVTLTE